MGNAEPWARDVHLALDGMDATQSRVIRMVYFERQTLPQVAERMSLPLAAAAHALATGMQAFARLIAKPRTPFLD